VAILTFAIVLTLAGSNDVLGSFLRIPVENVTRGLRVLVLVLPTLLGWVAYRVAGELRGREVSAGRYVVLTRTADGGFAEVHEHPRRDVARSEREPEEAARAERRAGRAERRARRALKRAERFLRRAKREERRAAQERDGTERPWKGRGER
jgi:hypothetical protein